EQVIACALVLVRESLGTERVAMFRRAEGDACELEACLGWDVGPPGRIHVRLAELDALQLRCGTFERGRTWGRTEPPPFLGLVGELEGLVVPVRYGEGSAIDGIVTAYTLQARQFACHHQAFLQAVANVIGTALL